MGTARRYKGPPRGQGILPMTTANRYRKAQKRRARKLGMPLRLWERVGAGGQTPEHARKAKADISPAECERLAVSWDYEHDHSV